MMKKLAAAMTVGITGVALSLGLVGCGSNETKTSTSTSSAQAAPDTDFSITIDMPPGDAVVVVKDHAFNPSVVTIKARQTVEWRIDDNGTPHSIEIEGLPRTENDFDIKMTSGRHIVSFPNRGTYPYHCGIHPEMTGTVHVE